MAVYNLIGSPFPFNHPDFLSDVLLQKKVRQLENFIELHHDLRQVSEQIEQITKINNLSKDIFDMGLDKYSLVEGLGCAAVMQYAKCFVKSDGRTSLNEKDIFTQQNHMTCHEFFMGLRMQLFAHHQLEANRHQIFVFPATQVNPIKLNPFGQTHRLLISSSIDWEPLCECISMVSEYLSLRIADICKNIEENLSLQQQNIINNTPRDVLLREYWRENSDNRKDSLSIRDKT